MSIETSYLLLDFETLDFHSNCSDLLSLDFPRNVCVLLIYRLLIWVTNKILSLYVTQPKMKGRDFLRIIVVDIDV